MKKCILVITLINIIANSSGQTSSSTLAPLLNFNFAGNKNTWTNFTPAIYYGWSKSIMPQKIIVGLPLTIELNISPYIGTTIAIKDSTSYLPALMLPGNAGLDIRPYFIAGDSSKLSFTFAPGIGMKVISGFTDSSLSLVQHFANVCVALKYSDDIMFTSFFTWTGHNSTDYSETNYDKVFPALRKSVQYLHLNLQTKLTNMGASDAPLYLTLSWRKFFTKDYNFLPNRRIFTVGFVSNLNLKNAGPTLANKVSLQ